MFVDWLVETGIESRAPDAHFAPEIQQRAARGGVIALILFHQHFLGNPHARADQRFHGGNKALECTVVAQGVKLLNLLPGRHGVNRAGRKLQFQFIVSNLFVLIYGILHAQFAVIGIADNKSRQHGGNDVGCKLACEIAVELLDLLDLRRDEGNAPSLFRAFYCHDVQHIGIACILADSVDGNPLNFCCGILHQGVPAGNVIADYSTFLVDFHAIDNAPAIFCLGAFAFALLAVRRRYPVGFQHAKRGGIGRAFVFLHAE